MQLLDPKFHNILLLLFGKGGNLVNLFLKNHYYYYYYYFFFSGGTGD